MVRYHAKTLASIKGPKRPVKEKIGGREKKTMSISSEDDTRKEIVEKGGMPSKA